MDILDLLIDLEDLKKKYREFCENDDSIRIHDLDHFHILDAKAIEILAKRLGKETILICRDNEDSDTVFPYIYKFDYNGIEVFSLLTEYEKRQIEMKGEKIA